MTGSSSRSASSSSPAWRADITALKFYRSASDTGTDVLDLWSATGTKLANVTFTNTAASGWQTVALPTPVSITANTTYIASYHTTGAYVAAPTSSPAAVTSGPLTAPSTTSAGGNGVYAYGGTSTAGIFPSSNSTNAANYYADVVFLPSSPARGRLAELADATDPCRCPSQQIPRRRLDSDAINELVAFQLHVRHCTFRAGLWLEYALVSRK